MPGMSCLSPDNVDTRWLAEMTKEKKQEKKNADTEGCKDFLCLIHKIAKKGLGQNASQAIVNAAEQVNGKDGKDEVSTDKCKMGKGNIKCTSLSGRSNSEFKWVDTDTAVAVAPIYLQLQWQWQLTLVTQGVV